MRRTILITMLVLSIASHGQEVANSAPLTNDDILKMVAAGFSETTITNAIEASEPAFDTSLDALLGLKNAGVSENIINAMLLRRGRSPSPAKMIIGKWRASTQMDYPQRHELISEAEFRADGSFLSVVVEGVGKGTTSAGTYRITNGDSLEIKGPGYTQTAQATFEGPNKMAWRSSDGRVSQLVRLEEASPPGEAGAATRRPEVKEPEYYGTVFYLDAGGELQPLERQTPVTRIKIRAMGWGGGKSLAEVSGARSPVRFKVGQTPEFVVRAYSGPHMDPRDSATLIVFQSKKNKREQVQFSSGGFLSSGITIDPKKGTLSISATRYGESSVKVTPTSPLPPGEYAFTSGSLDVFCFGVDPEPKQ